MTLLLLGLLGAGCATKKLPTGQDYYSQAENFYNRHLYKGAIDNYQHLIDQYPFSTYADDAELKIGLAYYQMKDYPEAINSLTDFIRMHPTNKNLPMASYYLGMAYYDQIPAPWQDQSVTEKALEQFRNIERQYPESPFAGLAHDRIEVCREMLARNELMIGTYYQKRANYRAAESRLAELMEKYPETPVAPDALYNLGVTLEKEGKKYSAAQAFAAVDSHYKDTKYAAMARAQLKKLNQPIDTEEDPLRMVLAEGGFGPPQPEPPLVVAKHHEEANANPDLTAADLGPGGDSETPPKLDAPLPEGPEKAASGEPVTLRGIRLASSANPLSVIFDVSGPVKFEKHLASGPGFASLTVHLINTQPDSKLDHHIVFDRSIFKDSDIKTDGGSTTVTVNTTPVARFAIIPLEDPSRLLVTFTPEERDLNESQGS
ncbi:MAG TPA: outer membrane protein assembly factor BamD [Candidatus Binataceae bacterium]|nr:outer membrane protein assembly factor BamD [Candidatus Binataceae bacterium]